ncbi:MAG: RNA polymerase sigma-70 factor [Bacteroidota bacterium]|nr:RNA polymerase sigma-70 factor [Bacteroidota bacterium]
MKKQAHIFRSLDEQNFRELFHLYFKPLTGFANHFLHDIDASKEVVHTVFVKLWEKRTEIDITQAVKTYLYTSVNNRCLNYIRNHKKFVKDDEVIWNTEQSDENSGFEYEQLPEIKRIIAKTLDRVGEKHAKVFELSRYEGLTYKEIADYLDISVKTVESRMSKVLGELRKDLSGYLTLLLILYFY